MGGSARSPATPGFCAYTWDGPGRIAGISPAGGGAGGALARTQYDEALSWAKLRYVSASANDWAAHSTAALLGRVWRARDMSDRTLEAFRAAQEDPAKPNPLAEVKLPQADAALLLARIPRVAPYVRTCIYILTGDFNAGMMDAREILLSYKNPETGDTEAITMMFRAADCSLRRARAFQQFLKSRQGPNPLDECLKQYPSKEK